MYVPRHFDAPSEKAIDELIERYSFGQLTTVVDRRPYVSHVPFLRDAPDRLLCHLAKSNPQTRDVNGAEALAVLSGPHAYVSPAWYESPGVPTWNYVAAHVYGRVEVIESSARLAELVERLTAVHESDSVEPWIPRYEKSQLDHIVGIAIHITEIQGKFKLSQNRPARDRANVIERLRTNGSDNATEVAALME